MQTQASIFSRHSSVPPTGHRKRSLPSWVLSLVIHVGLLILLAQLIRSPRSKGLPAPGRKVGIAVARSNGETVEYFEELASEEESSGSPSGESDTVTQQQALPAGDELQEIPALDSALPGRSNAGSPEGVVTEVEYSAVQRGAVPSQKAIEAARVADAARQRRREGQGPQTEVSLFGGPPAVGNSFIFVVDRSDSMGRNGLGLIARAKREFERVLASLESVHRFQIVAYNHQNVFFGGKRELVSASEPNKQLVGRFMGGLAAFGATNHFSAIMTGLHRSPDVLFLLTDGGSPSLRRPQVVRILKQARGRTTIHCIQFGRGASRSQEDFMVRLARETGGHYQYLDVLKE